MNTSEDGAEPMGEHPEVGSMTGALHVISRQAQVLGEVTALHRKVVTEEFGPNPLCEHCSRHGHVVLHPCETMRIVERVAL